MEGESFQSWIHWWTIEHASDSESESADAKEVTVQNFTKKLLGGVFCNLQLLKRSYTYIIKQPICCSEKLSKYPIQEGSLKSCPNIQPCIWFFEKLSKYSPLFATLYKYPTLPVWFWKFEQIATSVYMIL